MESFAGLTQEHVRNQVLTKAITTQDVHIFNLCMDLMEEMCFDANGCHFLLKGNQLAVLYSKVLQFGIVSPSFDTIMQTCYQTYAPHQIVHNRQLKLLLILMLKQPMLQQTAVRIILRKRLYHEDVEIREQCTKHLGTFAPTLFAVDTAQKVESASKSIKDTAQQVRMAIGALFFGASLYYLRFRWKRNLPFVETEVNASHLRRVSRIWFSYAAIVGGAHLFAMSTQGKEFRAQFEWLDPWLSSKAGSIVLFLPVWYTVKYAIVPLLLLLASLRFSQGIPGEDRMIDKYAYGKVVSSIPKQ